MAMLQGPTSFLSMQNILALLSLKTRKSGQGREEVKAKMTTDSYSAYL